MSSQGSGGVGAAGAGRPGLFQPFIGAILQSMPDEWRGTTFNNSALLGRETFTQRLIHLLEAKQAAGMCTHARTHTQIAIVCTAHTTAAPSNTLSPLHPKPLSFGLVEMVLFVVPHQPSVGHMAHVVG